MIALLTSKKLHHLELQQHSKVQKGKQLVHSQIFNFNLHYTQQPNIVQAVLSVSMVRL